MVKRIVTYDVRQGNDYADFYTMVEKYNAKKLTESTYEFNTNLNQESFRSMLRSAFSRRDLVYYISTNKEGQLFYEKITF